MDVIEYISRYIPNYLTITLPCKGMQQYVDGKGRFKKRELFFEFRLFVNHAHYDTRIGYFQFSTDYIIKKDERQQNFLYLFENISNQMDLLECLKELRAELKKDGLLPKGYNKPAGYTKKLYRSR